MRSVGTAKVIVPCDVARPRPALVCPRGPGGTSDPYMYIPRRSIALPAITFSDSASSVNPAGAMILTPSPTTARMPP